jgi:hypothetical protein
MSDQQWRRPPGPAFAAVPPPPRSPRPRQRAQRMPWGGAVATALGCHMAVVALLCMFTDVTGAGAFNISTLLLIVDSVVLLAVLRHCGKRSAEYEAAETAAETAEGAHR